MEFTDQTLSTQLYNYLCRKIGTEDVIRTRRAYYTALDYVTDKGFQISSGSKGEGLDMKGSDIDTMYVNRNIEIFESSEESPENSFFMDMDECKPGFTQLKQLNSKLTDYQIRSWCLNQGNDLVFSNEIFKTSCIKDVPIKTTVHGPCVSDPDGEFDFAYSFRCRTWIEKARSWLHRNRHWPSRELESKIANYGVLFVPIGSKGSVNEDLEWRISFSVAEKQLIYSFKHVQLLCYALLKILLKEIVDSTKKCKGLLCSYFLKTIVFWVSEDLPLDSWKPDKLLSNFRACLRRLLYCVEYSILPHYFISENNLFESRFDAVQHFRLKEKLSYHFRNLILGFRESETMADFFILNGYFSNHFFVTDNSACAITNTLASLIRNPIFRSSKFCVQRCISLFRNFNLKSDGFIFLLHFYKFASLYGFIEICKNEESNKCQYQRHRQYLPYIVMGTPGDSVLGWLHLGSYFYCSKQYQKCLHIFRYALSKCTPEKLYHLGDRISFDDLQQCEREAIELRYINYKHIYKNYVLSPIMFAVKFNIVPVELMVLIRTNYAVLIPPDVYCQFIIFLCLHHLYDDEECVYALYNLNRTVTKRRFTRPEAVTSLNCLGICYYVSGDLDIAELTFRKSLELDPEQGSFVSYMLKKIQNKRQ